MSIPTKFTIRVYGLLIVNNKLLLVNEQAGERSYTKFPGGGMELGEGTRDCLVREFMEELGIEITVGDHFYTTDFYLQSGFKPSDQLMSIYYHVSYNGNIEHIRLDKFKIEAEEGSEWLEFFWTDLSTINANMLTFPIDKVLAKMLLH